VADYSEFPTTPTGWQERQAQEWAAQDWQSVTPLATEDDVPRRRRVDLLTLIPGIFFVVLSIVLMTGVDLPLGLWRGGGFVWVLVVVGGIALLASELRKARRRRM
jgi:hypothetical protein